MVSLLIARLVDGSLPLQQVPDLPKGDALLGTLGTVAAPAAA